ncbi:hypothetical protein KXY27_004552 [Salmonella enterica]|nr:hypothetical protein [Salmonella enterica]EHU5767750.1 hypothetical protein [Salmonella enterica]
MSKSDVVLIVLLLSSFHSVPVCFGPLLKVAAYIVVVLVIVFHREFIKGWQGKA